MEIGMSIIENNRFIKLIGRGEFKKLESRILKLNYLHMYELDPSLFWNVHCQ